jgi:NAD(P)-dependent dehydrogenase (short-subunit alcohol dehydrogenase family)
MSPLYEKVTDITEEYYDKVSSVNLKGPFALSLRLGGHMYDHDGGVILNISTVGSIRPTRNEVVYAMAKSGLNAMTVALADAFGPKVRVNCILPGAILTDISKAWSEETIRNAHLTPMARAGYAEDFPGAALFFASEASAWITGTCLRVDGGAGRQLGL